ncbi:hypothetical protein V6N13_002287 [Hibiscus sabdariffa]|uniref:Protein kinase domain-containing protein n=1 Tax=Hibiscus sabdariffa TaxID=183260 RepID=A0ABR2C2P7_9ROSI
MKFYEGSIGDTMAPRKGGKLPFPYVLRYGIDLAQGTLELHSRGILVLNLKPYNFLLNETKQAVLGDIGIPYLLLGIRLPSSDMAHRLGTPNYMAPEQWQPEIRGPISFETDSWGFACSIFEMLTGTDPWHGKSADEIYDLVVRKQEKPLIPSGLPSLVEKILLGCIEHDFRSRPLMKDILHIFKSSEIGGEDDGRWTELGSTTVLDRKGSTTGYTVWFLSKDHLLVGDTVRSRKPPNSCKPENMDVPEGTVVGVEHSDGQHIDHTGSGNPTWLPPPVANIIFREGAARLSFMPSRTVTRGHDPIGLAFLRLENQTIALPSCSVVQLTVELPRHEFRLLISQVANISLPNSLFCQFLPLTTIPLEKCSFYHVVMGLWPRWRKG